MSESATANNSSEMSDCKTFRNLKFLHVCFSYYGYLENNKGRNSNLGGVTSEFWGQ
jgi:hypothetical protein